MVSLRFHFCLAACGFALFGFLPPSAGPAAAETLNIYNWSDYIAPGTLEKFKA